MLKKVWNMFDPLSFVKISTFFKPFPNIIFVQCAPWINANYVGSLWEGLKKLELSHTPTHGFLLKMNTQDLMTSRRIWWKLEYNFYLCQLTTTIAWHWVNMWYFSILITLHCIIIGPYDIPKWNNRILKNWKKNFFSRVPLLKNFQNCENCLFSMHFQNML